MIGKKIKNRRIELGLSADALAAKLNKNRATIYRYESNEIENLPTTVLEPLAEILQTTPAYLMGWEDAQEPCPPAPNPTEAKLKVLARHLDEIPEGIRKKIIRNFEETVDLYLSATQNKLNKGD